MKVDAQYHAPALWDFVSQRLPPSLIAKKTGHGYGYFFGIYRRDQAPGFIQTALECVGDPVAQIIGNELSLNFPEYYSDFAQMLQDFEASTGIEATLRYWQSPKDATHRDIAGKP